MNKTVPFLSMIIMLSSCDRNGMISNHKLTGINPLAYTGVTYIASRDTVMVSTYSGRIAKRIKGLDKEIIVTNIDDEIYSLAYCKTKNEIIVSTFSSGILVLNASTGEKTQTIPLGKTWINTISIFDDTLLVGIDGLGENHLWDISKEYAPVEMPQALIESVINLANNQGIFFSSRENISCWNPKTNNIRQSKKPKGQLVDCAKDDVLLTLYHDELIKTDLKDSSSTFSKKHADWPFYNVFQNKVNRIPYQMKLTNACFAKNKIFSAGIDRSIRVWDKESGEHLKDILKHKATISGMAVSKDETQIVTVDLKGGIEFLKVN